MTGFGRKSLLLGALAIFSASTLSAAFSPAEAADRLRRECEADGAGDISMDAKYERRSNGRKKFSVEFEARAGGKYEEGERISIVVAGENVGSVRLDSVAGGDVVGDLNFDTQQPNDPDEKPFPPNFPQISKGTKVKVKSGGDPVLGCSLS